MMTHTYRRRFMTRTDRRRFPVLIAAITALALAGAALALLFSPVQA